MSKDDSREWDYLSSMPESYRHNHEALLASLSSSEGN